MYVVWILFLISKNTFAQTPPPIEWERSLGGSENENALAVDETAAGKFIIAGFAYSNDDDVTGHHCSTDFSDFWVVQLEADGSTAWKKVLGERITKQPGQLTRQMMGDIVLQDTLTQIMGMYREIMALPIFCNGYIFKITPNREWQIHKRIIDSFSGSNFIKSNLNYFFSRINDHKLHN